MILCIESEAREIFLRERDLYIVKDVMRENSGILIRKGNILMRNEKIIAIETFRQCL